MNTGSRTERLTGDGLLARADALHAELCRLLAPGDAVTLDLSGVVAADISFVQLLVSASRTAARDGGCLTLTGLSPKLEAALALAGVGFDRAAGRLATH